MEYPYDFKRARYIMPDEIVVRAVHQDEVKVLAKMSGLCKDWPDEFVHNGVTYLFNGNDIMPDGAAGIYSGCASYKRVADPVVERPAPPAPQQLMNKQYHGFEAMSDIERDVYESIADANLPGEFQGTIAVTITYIPDEL